jgi:hypothetical protein
MPPPRSRGMIVREQIRDAHGRTWSDVSAWYWSAVWNPDAGPWFATTVFEAGELS